MLSYNTSFYWYIISVLYWFKNIFTLKTELIGLIFFYQLTSIIKCSVVIVQNLYIAVELVFFLCGVEYFSLSGFH